MSRDFGNAIFDLAAL